MPNHFQVVALCARDWKRLELQESDDIDFEPLKETNLCQVACPMPDELSNIVASRTPCRYRHKTTGEWYADCNPPMDDAGDYEQVDLTGCEQEQLLEKYGACTWYDWQTSNWGTKWGTYNLDVHMLGGDGSPVLIEFQCAWGPPSPEIMRKIDTYLCETYCLQSIKWIGHDPYDGMTCDIEIAEDSRSAGEPGEANGSEPEAVGG